MKVTFERIYNEEYGRVFRLCKGYFGGNKVLAEDAAQEVFLKVLESLDSYRNEAKVSTWIYRIAVNVCLMHLRKGSVRNEIRTDQLPEFISETYSEEEDQKLKQMYSCIQKLDELNRSIVLMLLEGLEYAEIADVTGIKEETLRVRIHRIKQSLTKCVTK